MAAPPYFREVTLSIAADVRATLSGELSGKLGPQPLDELVDEVHGFAETLVQSLVERVPEDRRTLPVCKAGCDSCCRLHAVFVAPAEVLRLGAHLRAQLSADDLAALKARLATMVPAIAEMSRDDRARERIACPLLDASGGCGVHPVRPLLCRGYNSHDLDACLRAFDRGRSAVSLPSSADQASACQSVFAGLLLGGAADGRDGGPVELIAGLWAALSDPESEARWLDGERVFDVEASRVSREQAEAWQAFIARELPDLGR